jgi:hypothetical protein
VGYKVVPRKDPRWGPGEGGARMGFNKSNSKYLKELKSCILTWGRYIMVLKKSSNNINLLIDFYYQ